MDRLWRSLQRLRAMSRRPLSVSERQGYRETRLPSPADLVHATPVRVSYAQQLIRVRLLSLLLLMDNQCRKTQRNRGAAALVLSRVSPPEIHLIIGIWSVA